VSSRTGQYAYGGPLHAASSAPHGVGVPLASCAQRPAPPITICDGQPCQPSERVARLGLLVSYGGSDVAASGWYPMTCWKGLLQQVHGEPWIGAPRRPHTAWPSHIGTFV